MLRSVLRSNIPLSIRKIIPTTAKYAPTRIMIPMRYYSNTVNKLNKTDVETRVSDVIKAFSKSSANTDISAQTSFHQDLGLDSLDTVELLVAIEEEFEIEFPDKVADELKTVGETIDYVASNPESV